MKKLLLTGFEPFLDFPINPTMKIAEELDSEIIGEYRIHATILSVDFKKAGGELIQAIKKEQPDAVISLGLAAGRFKITPERIAVNVNHGPADNEGHIPIDETIHLDGADGYLSTLPIRDMVDALNEAGLPADVSDTAGTYLCNHVMYQGLYYMIKRNLAVPSGFIHIPASHELAIQHEKIPSWSHEDLKKGIAICIKALSNHIRKAESH
ncbi:pyroglutamyl-peptidase I [Cytobacillus purgationiresistens]|uniref:Pyrrolidone-carboxylate peptidase n=1 Tax=Cytobacillus purgationiresistens TaxID=863449 RepID=A0ABU0AN69_9BACI|nr:pyroglutamyl-peptidase I [Cytobacillus purgationiresistens]MDQ0272635.1 pyroglutamyl-peptidase [Cytobacillus purgationiresistens]